jgi:hypothetical protein
MQLEERKQAQKEVKRRGKEEVLPAADVKKMVEEGDSIPHAVQIVVDQYGRAIDEEIKQ